MRAIDGVPAWRITSSSSRRSIVEDGLDARLAEGGEAPDVRPADADGGGAERERLEDVGAAAEAAVDEHRHRAARALDDFRAGTRWRRGRCPRIGRRGSTR